MADSLVRMIGETEEEGVFVAEVVRVKPVELPFAPQRPRLQPSLNDGERKSKHLRITQ